MSEIYCKAPWVSVSYMPGGKYLPCCAYGSGGFDSREQMTEQVGGAFLRGEVPKECKNSCPADRPGWREMFARFETDYKTHQIQFLDFRNNNTCNMKCRSCGPGLSTLWASEAKAQSIVLHESTPIDNLDLSRCQEIYFAGGEPLLNPQHYEILEKLIEQGAKPSLMYSTNVSVLGYKSKHVKDLWPHFDRISIHASIDAVGTYAEIVRSGSVWKNIESNLKWILTQPNIYVRVATVISAINIWFLPSLFEYFDWLDDLHKFEPVLANVDSVIGLASIPDKFRPSLIEMLEQSKYSDHVNIVRAVDALKNTPYNKNNWNQFIAQQLIQDNYRNEKWFDSMPIKHEIYKEVLSIG